MKVKVIIGSGGMSLIQWRSGEEEIPTRAWVRDEWIEEVGEDKFEVSHPERGIPYGVDLAQLIELEEVTPRDISREVRRVGLWTIEDFRRNPDILRGALSAVYGLTIAKIFQALERHEADLT